MINIENAQVITYGNDQSVTVYQDFTDANTYYIVPQPVIPLGDDGLPQFSLLSYTTGTEVTGTCSFQTELQVSDAALAAVKAKLGAGIKIGQLDWQSVQVVFHFATATNAALELIATPSMYGANRASFIIHMPDSDTYQAFEAGFGPDGSAAGTFMLEYDVTALTRLPPATVTVDFNAQTAFDYQRTVNVSRDTWGHVTSETVSITEHLQQSKAGTISVDPGGRPLDAETQKRLMQWGNDTLANDVEQAVAAVTRMMDSNTAPTFNMSAISSFHDVYSEGQVVPWFIKPRANIPAFSPEVWAKVSKSVSIRPMKAAFTVQDLERNNVASIDLVVSYPLNSSVPAANNTYQFTPKTPSSWIFEAPGQSSAGVFDGTYSYHYVVNYSDGTAPFHSAEIKSTQSAVHLTANDLNVLYLEFSADNVPFKAAGDTGSDLVDYVLIDMFFVNQTTGQPIQMQQARLDATKTSAIFHSPTTEPFANPCSYRLTYVLTTNQKVIVDWTTTTLAAPLGQGTSIVPVIHLSSPFQGKTISLFPMPPSGKSFQMLAVNATYSDTLNNLNEQNQWAVTDFSTPPKAWNFLAPANQNTQIISFDGQYVLDGNPGQLQAVKTSSAMLIIDPLKPMFSVTVDPSQIEWAASNFTQVEVTLYTKDAAGQNKLNVRSLEPFHSDNNLNQLYTFNFDASTTPVCYYTAQYWIKDQPAPAVIEETELSATAHLTLLGKPPSAVLQLAERRASEIQSARARAFAMAAAR